MDELNQVNTSMDDETKNKLEFMSKADGINNRSAFIRVLIHKEWKSRYGDVPVPLTNIVQPNPESVRTLEG